MSRTCHYLVTIHDVGNITDDPRNIHTILTSTDNIQPRERVKVVAHDPELSARVSTCQHCERLIVKIAGGAWIDPEATGDDEVWRETCDRHDTFTAEHEPE